MTISFLNVCFKNPALQVTDEALREQFAKYGTIEEIKILSKPDGKRLGCAFIQFELAQDASKAVHYENMKPLLGRPMVVDKAVAKTKFEKATKSVEVKPEIEEIEIKEEPEDEDSKEIFEDVGKSEASDNDDSKEEESSEDEDSENFSEEEKSASDEEKDDVPTRDDEARPRVISNDVNEGKTVFLKNVPFAVKNEELRECMEQYGPVYYALICMDPLTEHSKGTAFVKFRVSINFNLEFVPTSLSVFRILIYPNSVIIISTHVHCCRMSKMLKNACPLVPNCDCTTKCSTLTER